MGTGRLSTTGIKKPGREAGNSPESSAEIKNGGAIPPLLCVFMAWRLINYTRKQIYLYIFIFIRQLPVMPISVYHKYIAAS
jgi:hypothetical protein